jgi:hypothetical protein
VSKKLTPQSQIKDGAPDGESKMNKAIGLFLVASIFLSSDYGYHGSTTGVVTLVGSVIKTSHIDKEKKYPRKECPVCKGTGKYLSGDGIKMVDCGYCEPENKESEVTHPPAILKPDCKTKVHKK